MKKVLRYTGLVILVLVLILVGNLLVFNITADRISEGTPIPEYEKQQSSLLVIDIQESTSGTTSLIQSYVDQSAELIQKINAITALSSSSQIPVIYIRNEVTNPLINILNNAMAQGSVGASLDQRLVLSSNYIIPKTKNDAFSNQALDQLLASQKVNHIVLTGLDAAFCVNCTLQGALNRGFRVTVIEDAVITAPVEQKKKMMQQFREMGVETISMSEYMASLSTP